MLEPAGRSRPNVDIDNTVDDAYFGVMTTTAWTAADLSSWTGRTVVVTGANSGLGLVTSRELDPEDDQDVHPRAQRR